MREPAQRRRRALRIAEQRNSALKHLLLYRGFREAAGEPVPVLRRARAIATVFERYPVEIGEDDLLLGRYTTRPLTDEEEKELPEARGYLWSTHRKLPYLWHGITGSHRAIDFERVLRQGVAGVLDEVRRRRDTLGFDRPDDGRRDCFYEACEVVLEGLLAFAERYRRAAEEAAHAAPNPTRAEELRRLANIFSRVPREPARDFYEALQSAWFVQFATAFDDASSSGRPDRYLYPYYRADVEAGRLTPETTHRLIAELYLRSNEVYGDWPETIMLGGSTAAGEPVLNDLTRSFIEAVETVGLVNPNVALCYREDIPDDVLLLCLDKISKGLTHPALFNDGVITEGLIQAGLEPADACNYINSTCTEITPIGCSGVMVNAARLYPGKALEMVLNDGRQIVEDERFLPHEVGERVVRQWQRSVGAGGMGVERAGLRTFEKFYAAYREALANMIEDTIRVAARQLHATALRGASPLTSCFTRDCIERGMDSASGGARYNYCGVIVAGFSTAVDSLLAVREMVYRRDMISLDGLADALRRDFQGAEDLRQFALNHCPRYGNDDPDADDLAVDFYDFICMELGRYRTCLGGRFYPGLFSGWGGQVDGKRVSLNVSRGLVTGATPDGRRAGKPLSANIGPAPGSDRTGLTALVNSVTCMDHRHGLGGISVNCRLSKDMFRSAAGRRKLLSFVRTFMRKGGFQIQFNVVDSPQLREAKREPEQHRTLMVRVAGYSDYFCNLGAELQDEIIARTEHDGG